MGLFRDSKCSFRYLSQDQLFGICKALRVKKASKSVWYTPTHNPTAVERLAVDEDRKPRSATPKKTKKKNKRKGRWDFWTNRENVIFQTLFNLVLVYPTPCLGLRKEKKRDVVLGEKKKKVLPFCTTKKNIPHEFQVFVKKTWAQQPWP